MNFDIKLKVTTAELQSAWEFISFNFPNVPNNEKASAVKSYLSILEDTRNKMAKKILSKKSHTKPYDWQLRYHEANAIHKTLKLFKLEREAQKLFDQLDQKLA